MAHNALDTDPVATMRYAADELDRAHAILYGPRVAWTSDEFADARLCIAGALAALRRSIAAGEQG